MGVAAAQQPGGAYPERELVLGGYVWGSELVGTIEADAATADVDASFSDILDKLNVGVMLAGAARRGRFLGMFDAMWIELEEEIGSGTVQVGPLVTLGPAELDAKVSQGMLDLKAGYRLLEPEGPRALTVDVLAGARYWYFRNEIELDFAILPDVDFDESVDWVDPVVGMRFGVALTPTVSFFVLGDVGGWGVGSASDSTWQLTGLVGVELGPAWSLRLGYRALDIDRDQADFQMRGPIVGVLHRF